MSRRDRFSWFTARQRQQRPNSHRLSRIGSPYARRLRVEALEDRRMLAVITVQNDLDDTLVNLAGDGQLSLREAIEIANNQGMVIDGFSSGDVGDTIEFAPALSGSTISLTDGELLVTEELSIDATPLSANVNIDAQLQSRIFHITANLVDYTLAGLTLTGGRTTASSEPGGAIRFTGNGSLTLDQSVVSGNSTLGQNSPGGGIFSHGPLTLTQSTVSGNSTADSFAAGGGIFANGAITLNQSTVSGNTTSGLSTSDGGGIATGSSITLNQSTVSGNRTHGNSDGGGIASSGPVTLMHSTVTDNHTTYSHVLTTGGGIWNFDDPVIIAQSIVAGNTSVGGADDLDPGTGTLTVDFSLIGDNDGTGLTEAQTADANGNLIGSAAGSGIINPLLDMLADNGGLTNTHKLLLGSPALNAGDPAAVAGVGDVPLQDQRGAPFPRVFGMAIDIGAVEDLQDVFIVDTAFDESDGDFSPGDLSLREAVILANGRTGPDTITFDASLDGATILKVATQWVITDDLMIDASTLPSGLTIDAQQNGRIFFINTTMGDYTIKGLTLTSALTGGGGAAVLSYTSGLLSIEQSTITGNGTNGSFGGGGVYAYGDVSLIDSVISNNSTIGTIARGGGLIVFGTLMLTRSTVSGNSTLGTSADGGGILSGPVTGSESIISDNHSGHYGGGIHAYGEVVLSDSVVSGNFSEQDGGGIYANEVHLTDSVISGNLSNGGFGGGGIYTRDGSPGYVTLVRSTLSGNQVNTDNGFQDGAGIRAGGDVTLIDSTVNDNDGYPYYDAATAIFTKEKLTIVGSTISNNSGAMGSILSWDALTIRHSTITENDGGVRSTFGAVTIGHSIIADNDQFDLDPGSGILTVNYTLISDADGQVITGTGNIIGDSQGAGIVDPMLGLLADNGGPTSTHALMPGSPALDAGDPAAVAGVGNVPDFDQRGGGFDRVMNGRIEIGAYEVTPSADFDSSGFIDGLDFLLWQRGFGAPAPTATPLDGDADFDLDSDGNDLSIWEMQFGQAAPTFAPVVAATEALEPIKAAEPLLATELDTFAEPILGTTNSVSTSDVVQLTRRFILDNRLVDTLFPHSSKRLQPKWLSAQQERQQVENVVDRVLSDVRDLYHSLDSHHEDHDRDHKHERRSRQAEAADEYFGSITEDALELELSL